ncbi:MAG: ComEC/Rec2 family competence protein [Patescibacteria group bacterium]
MFNNSESRFWRSQVLNSNNNENQGSRAKRGVLILGFLASFNILAWVGVWQLNQPHLEVTFFDVGQGDAIFIETTEHQQILIDGGPSGQKVLEKLGKEMPFWDRTIDLIVLTHPERDHMAGLLEVLKRYRVQNILWTGVVRDTSEYREWQKLIEVEGANIYIAYAGLQISGEQFSADPRRTVLRILYPFESLEGKEVKDSNNTSIILRLVYGEISFLFTGDATQSVERQLLKRDKPSINADVLKVGHHGSKTSTVQEFVEAVSPETAVISLGKDNSYGHPHQATLDTLAKYGISILRTDISGDIKIFSDGNNLNFKY